MNLDFSGLQFKTRSHPAGATGKKNKPPILESAFPVWTKDTPAHVILGVPEAATEAVIEEAYRALLRRYHPDRFANCGQGYQTRAHHIILLLQSAREQMLGLRKRN
jgi:DnaJ-domain-containing protein 1